MPELPEVERARRLLERVAVGRSVRRARAARDPIVFEGVSPGRIRSALEGREIVAARRRGKHLYLELDQRPWPLFHLGMTGGFRVPGAAALPLATTGRQVDDAWPPRFTRLEIHLDDGGRLAFTNARRLGRVRLRDDPLAEPPLSTLGFDPLLDLPDAQAFTARIGRRRITLKGLLLDQSFAAGVGNWMADEVLYQARLDPRRPAASLDGAEARRMRAALKRITDRAVAVDAEKERLPRTWLFHHRWGRVADARTARGEKIEFLEVAGRTTAWVPARQR